jgi:hypothetical protein
MNRFALAILPLLLCSPAAGQTGPAESSGFAHVIQDEDGQPILVISYPWQVHEKGSIEVGTLPADPALVPQSRPLRFQAQVLKGEVSRAVLDVEDGAFTAPTSTSFTVDDTQFEVIGQRNSLGAPAAVTVWRTTLERPIDRADALLAKIKSEEEAALAPAPAGKPTVSEAAQAARDIGLTNRAAFYPLKPWSLDRRTLYLDLPETHFARPSSLRVWFMRGNDVVWLETIAWPGYPQRPAAASPARPAKPAK